MIVKTRVTAAGTEYWDNKDKKVIFVPAGKEPDFEVTVNPKSMLKEQSDGLNPGVIITDETYPNLDSLTVKELRAYAAELEIEIPDNIKKRDDIIKLLSEAE